MPAPTTRQLLDFEAAHPNHPPWKDLAIEDAFGIPSARYYQLRGRVNDEPDALEVDPMLVHRLRRLRDRAEGRSRGRQRIA